MLTRLGPVTREAEALWVRRSNALEAGSQLMAEKPERDEWSDQEIRLWRYAVAISRRMEKLQ